MIGSRTPDKPELQEWKKTIQRKVSTGTFKDMIICGNDGGAKKQVAEILREFGWNDSIDVGGVDGARWLGVFVPVWVRLAANLGSWTVAITVLRS